MRCLGRCATRLASWSAQPRRAAACVHPSVRLSSACRLAGRRRAARCTQRPFATMEDEDTSAEACPEAKPPAPDGGALASPARPHLDQKAAVRACRNAIEFNSLPAVRKIVPGGYDNLRLHVKLGSPRPADVDVEELRKVFPYGEATFEVVEGGLACSSGVAIPELGDTSDEMVIAVAAVTVGYSSACAAARLQTPVKGYGCDSDDE